MPARSQKQREWAFGAKGESWAREHHFDNKGSLPERVQHDAGVPGWANYEPATEPGKNCGTCDYYVSGRCEMFDYAPVLADYVCNRWDGQIEKDEPLYTGTDPDREPVEPPGRSLIDLLEAIEPVHKTTDSYPKRLNRFHGRNSLSALVNKTEAHPCDVLLRVHGMSRTPDGLLSYRMMSRDNHYVGRTNATNVRAKKGDTLRVSASDLFLSDLGDLHWQNANVVGSGYTDTPHSWKELEAMAGAPMEKDGADGVAGDIPASGDVGDIAAALRQQGDVGALAATEGPTSSDVHVNVPLKNLSVAYMNRKFRYEVKKADPTQQLIYGVVLEPNALDSQDDYMLPNQVEKAAHTYLKKVVRGKASVSKLQHRAPGFFKSKPGVIPVESFVAPVDFSYDGKEMVKKGTWVMVLHVENPDVWDGVMKGDYTGLSIGGTGIRQEMRTPEDEREFLAGQPADWFRDAGIS